MIPIVFKETKQTEFIEYIEHSKSCYITKPGRYNVTYNISYQSDIEYLSVMFLSNMTIMKSNTNTRWN